MSFYLELYSILNSRFINYAELKNITNKLDDNNLKRMINNFIEFKSNRRNKKEDIIEYIEKIILTSCKKSELNKIKYLLYKLKDYSNFPISHIYEGCFQLSNNGLYDWGKVAHLLEECLIYTRNFIIEEIQEILNKK